MSNQSRIFSVSRNGYLKKLTMSCLLFVFNRVLEIVTVNTFLELFCLIKSCINDYLYFFLISTQYKHKDWSYFNQFKHKDWSYFSFDQYVYVTTK